MGDEITDYCIKKWEADETDPRIEHFVENKTAFYNGLSMEMKTCVDTLLQEFSYYSHPCVNSKYVSLHQQLLNENGIDIEYTVFSCLPSQNKTYNSSYTIIPEYKCLNNISKNYILPNLQDCFSEEWWPSVQNIVFIDDFCGSGKTFRDYLELIKPSIIDKKIFYVVIHIMRQGLDIINQYAEDNKLPIYVLSSNCTEPAFSIRNMQKYEVPFKNLSCDRGIDKRDIMGFQNSQALVAFYQNSPNNTLGLFIKRTTKNEPLFPRETEKKPSFMLKNGRMQRRVSNYVRDQKSRRNGCIF